MNILMNIRSTFRWDMYLELEFLGHRVHIFSAWTDIAKTVLQEYQLTFIAMNGHSTFLHTFTNI